MPDWLDLFDNGLKPAALSRRRYNVRYRRSVPVHGWRTEQITGYNVRSASRIVYAQSVREAMESTIKDVQARQPDGTTVTIVGASVWLDRRWKRLYSEPRKEEVDDWGD